MGLNDFILNIYKHIIHNQAFLVAQLVENLPAMQETLVQFLGWKNSPGEGIGYTLSILGLPWWLRQ